MQRYKMNRNSLFNAIASYIKETYDKNITLETTFVNDLSFDSLCFIELLNEIYIVANVDMDLSTISECRTVGDLIDIIVGDE